MQDETRYQVFVSSTFTDLKDERDKALQAILELRAFPTGMELFPAADEDQFEFIKREIDSSDYYVVIIGGRYGSVASDGVSYTEKEYDYARATNKPTLAFIVRDTGKLIGDKLEKSEQLREKLRLFTEKAKSSKLVKFFSNPDELKSAVLVSLPSQFNLRPMRGWVRAGSTPREDLQKIADLQERVIRLEEENAAYREAAGANAALLAGDADPISWTLNLNTFGVGNALPVTRTIEFESTWDNLLNAIFSDGSSTANEIRVRQRIMDLIATSDGFDAPPQWHEQFNSFRKNPEWKPTAAAVELLLIELHRQFTGLRLITDAQETIYVPQQYSQTPKPVTLPVWRLTSKGQMKLALTRGYKRREAAST
jgi:hypothetical protein